MLTSILVGLGLVLLFEGLGPLLMPKAWQQMLRLMSEQPPAQLAASGAAWWWRAPLYSGRWRIESPAKWRLRKVTPGQ